MLNKLLALICVAASLGLLLSPRPLYADELLAGVAVVDITPPTGYRMCGYFNERLSTGAHDPLQAKALVFRQSDVAAALVSCDLAGISRFVTERARRLAAQRTGIPAACILVHATHSHTGPLFEGALRNHFHEQALQKQGRDPYEAIDYPGFLVERIADAVAQAHQQLQPAALAAGVGTQRGLSFNRRFHMKDGSVVFNPGKLNPNIVRPAGPIDPDLGVLLVKSAAEGQPRAALVNFALHLDTVGGTEYAADYPFYLERTLRQHLGNQFVALFGNGACGDINHVDVTHNQAQKGHEEAARIGNRLAETVRAQLGGLAQLASKLAVRTGIVEVPLQRFNAAEVESAGKAIFKVGTSEISFLEQVAAVKIREVLLQPAAALPIEVQVFRMADDLAIVGLPGEVFVELGLAIKRNSPFARTLVIELCNDDPAYIPTSKAFAEGSYETVNSIIAPGGGERMVELALKLLREAKEGAVPAADQSAAIELFNGRNLEGWRDKTGDWLAAAGVQSDPGEPAKFKIEPGAGILVNGPAGKTVNLVTSAEFADVEAHIEFCVPKGSNSGVYFMGRYEIQVLDSFGKEELNYGDNGGIYRNEQGFGGRKPDLNASKAPGEWQSFDVLFRAPRFDGLGKKKEHARFIKVVHNGQLIHENVEVNGPTIAAAFREEAPSGPIMLQGDHGPVAYRNLRIKKLTLP